MSKKQIFLFYNIKVNYLMETQGNIVFSFGEYFDVHDGGHVHIHHGQEQSDSDTKPEAEAKTTNEKPEESEEEKPAGKESADKESTDKKNSDTEPDDEKKKEEQLREVLSSLASVIKRSRKYKWGLAKQALVRKGMVAPGISINEFAAKVSNLIGISESTVRNQSEFYDYRKQYEDTIQSLCAIIDKAKKDASQSQHNPT